MHPRDWIEVRPEGVFCKAGGVFIDPMQPVAHAIITHGHADHARAGHGHVYATPETLAIMRARYGDAHALAEHPIAYGETFRIDGVTASLHPAGHILGSAQARLEYHGSSI
ncbi:MAG: ligase-associated DNA damage response exonuclease, partial [Asticcacaulis sp.]